LRITTRASLALAALIAAGCGGAGVPHIGGPAATRARVTVVERYFEEGLDGCAPGDSGCAWVRFSYPSVEAAPTRVAADSMNAWIRATVFEPAESGDSIVTSADRWAATFFARNADFRRQFPDASAGWYVRRAITLHGDTLGIACFRYTHERFGGGAHPLTEVFYRCFDSRSGRSVTLDSLVHPGMRAALDSIGERAFRAARAIPEGQNLKDAMFTFEGGRFELPDNVGLGANGMTVEFNPYDVAPYVAGPTSFTLPWSEVGPLLDLPPRPPAAPH
jgi:hypothetical protein